MTETTLTGWSWKQSPELMRRLMDAQNSPAFANQDICTIVGFFESEAELLRHLTHCENRVAKQEGR